MRLLKLLFSFEGRIGRGQFWLASAIYAAVAIIVVAISLAVESYSGLMALQLIPGIPVLISLVAVGIKRLHDRNKSAWWLLMFYLLPAVLPWFGLIGSGGGNADPDAVPTAVVVLVYARFAILIWALVEFGCLRGTIGGNPYGSDPVAPRPAAH